MGIIFSVTSFFSSLLTKKHTSKFQPSPGIILYDSAPSPCARRVRMTLLEKGIPFKKVEVDLLKGEQLTEEYKHICPNRKVPAISFLDVPGIEDCSLYESNVITEFLDADAFPGPKLYPSNHWERAQVKMWQDWELGLVDDFVPLMYTNTIPFLLQLMHGSKDSFLSSLPAEISPAKKEHWSNVYDASLASAEELKQHAIACYHNLITLETALEGRKYLVGNKFTSADLSVLPRVRMYSQIGLHLPEAHFPNTVSYLRRLGEHNSIRRSQPFQLRLMNYLISWHTNWIVRLGNWRSGRNLQRIDGSVFVDQALSTVPVWRHKETWHRKVQELEGNSVLLADCPVYPECWQIKLLLREKGMKFTTLQLNVEEVVGRWAGSEGLVRVHHMGHDVTGIRAVLDYLDGVCTQNSPRLVPKDPLLRAKAQAWQGWDYTLGYTELSRLLETRLISKSLTDRYFAELPRLYDLKTGPYNQCKFLSILQCFICGVMKQKNSEDTVKDLQGREASAVARASKMIKEEEQWEALLRDRLKHLEKELQCRDPYLLGQTLTVADVNIFCRMCFLQGLGLVDTGAHQNVAQWLQLLKETRPQFLSISQEIAELFSKLSQ